MMKRRGHLMGQNSSMRYWVIAVALSFATVATPQSINTVVGTWKLISAANVTEKGERIENAYGLNPTGFLTYTTDGRMMGIINYGARKAFSSVPPPEQERAEAFSTFLAYAGRYTVSGDRIIHHVEAAWRQDWVNTDQVRFIVKLQDNRLILRTPPITNLNGLRLTYQELVWERLKADAANR
jgi:Lipocalin-like domain